MAAAGGEIERHARQASPGSADICLLIEERIEDAVLELAHEGTQIEPREVVVVVRRTQSRRCGLSLDAASA
jgi:hypothetical protein